MSNKMSSGKWWTIAGISLLAFFTFKNSSKASPASPTSPSPLNGLSPDQVKTTIRNVLMANGYGAQISDNWYLISKMETAGFTSNAYKRYNNLFGMHQPVERKTNSIGGVWSESEKAYLASYNSVEDSAQDLVYYMQARKYPIDFNDLESQLKFMQSKGYFTIPLSRYIDLVKVWEKR